MKCLWIALALAGATVMAGSANAAASVQAQRRQAEASMLVTGSVHVAADGHVDRYALDKQEKLPPEVVSLIRQNVPVWHFQTPASYHADTAADAKMSLRILARPTDDKNFALSIAGANFTDPADKQVSYKDRSLPKYPPAAIQARVTGTVYVLVRIDPQGNVSDAVARQVDLGVVGSELEMAHWRDVLTRSSLAAIRQWTFNTPAPGAVVSHAGWSVLLPVAYHLSGPAATRHGYGVWDVYVPGPIQPVPWQDEDRAVSASPDAVVDDDGIYTIGTGLKLLSPLNHA